MERNRTLQAVSISVVVSISAVAGACSGSYEKETGGFSTAVTAMAASFESYNDTDADVDQRRRVAFAAEEGAEVDPVEVCDQIPDAMRSQYLELIRIVRRQRSAAVSPAQKAAIKKLQKLDCRIATQDEGLAGVPIVDKGRKVAKLLVGYAGGLHQLATAKDLKDVESSGKKLSAQIASLLKAFPGQATGTPSVGAIIDPLSTAALWVGTKYLERKRYLVLRDATAKAHESVALAADLLAQQQLGLHYRILYNRYHVISSKTELYNDELRGLDGERRMARLNGLLAEEQALLVLRAKDPTAVFSKMTSAHAKLRDALADGAGNSEDVFAELEEFGQVAGELLAAIRKVKGAS